MLDPRPTFNLYMEKKLDDTRKPKVFYLQARPESKLEAFDNRQPIGTGHPSTCELPHIDDPRASGPNQSAHSAIRTCYQYVIRNI